MKLLARRLARVLTVAWLALLVGAQGLEVIEETSDHRVVRHAQGETRIPAQPQCVVVAGSGYLEQLLTLGVTPCGAAEGGGGSGFPAHLGERVERVAEFDAEHIFFLDQTDDAMGEMAESSLWQNVPAVQQGNLYRVDVRVWIQGGGILAYRQVIDDVLSTLAGERE